MAETALAKQRSPNTHPTKSTAKSQAIVMQKLCFEAANDPAISKKDLAALMRAWCDLNEERRKLAMKPLPKSVDVDKLKAARRARARTGPAHEEISGASTGSS